MNKEITIYLKKQGVTDKDFFSFMLGTKDKDLCFKLCSVDGFDFMVSHFFDDSEQSGYGLISTNDMLKTTGSQFTAFGLIEGDDVICLNSSNGAIYIWLIQTGNGEYIKVSSSFKEFINECIEL